MRFAKTTTRRVKHKGEPVYLRLGKKDASLRSCKALRRLSQSRTPLFCSLRTTSPVLGVDIVPSVVATGSRLERLSRAVYFKKINQRLEKVNKRNGSGVTPCGGGNALTTLDPDIARSGSKLVRYQVYALENRELLVGSRLSKDLRNIKVSRQAR